ncbi:MAG: PilZ domain-containing protein [Treponema sp.]|jgi:c-di-GMP-binding flagellar brake protein YcgR|nr:PilZ domain-containing protein [Treponema sp.]
MAVPAGRIESEFYFKVLFDEKLALKFIKDRVEYHLTLDQPVLEEMVLRTDRPIPGLKPRTKIALLFNHRGQSVDFSTEIIKVSEEFVICKTPEKLHKNLDRNYLRIDTPSDIKVLFTFRGDRYNLSLPKVSEYESVTANDLFGSDNTRNLSDLIKQLTGLVKNFADGYKIVNFKDKKPETMEEKIVSVTGKALYLPSTVGRLPATDPYPKKRIVTEEIFKRYLESTGVGEAYLGETCTRFMKNKFNDGIYSDAWVPILFHEYVVGYIHIWINKEGRPSFDYTMLDNLFQFSKVLAFSLKENGYFENGKIQNEPFEGRVLDISASGLLFACPHGFSIASLLVVDSDLTVTIEAPNRTINVVAKIVRRYKDKNAVYFGCRFMGMVPEDMRFLFEYLYGRQIDDSDSAFLSGQV